jgi:Na+/H+ antiporter NhaD/arsenite permease-like protein
MLPIIRELGLMAGANATPPWWALISGAGIAGNGTPARSTVGVVIVNLSEKTATPITFKSWIKAGVPVTIASRTVGSLIFVAEVFLRYR